eukprot:6331865-Amphidinium_carterae.1
MTRAHEAQDSVLLVTPQADFWSCPADTTRAYAAEAPSQAGEEGIGHPWNLTRTRSMFLWVGLTKR